MNKKITIIIGGVVLVGLLTSGFIFMNHNKDTNKLSNNSSSQSKITATIKHNDSSKSTSTSEDDELKSSKNQFEIKTTESSKHKDENENSEKNMQLIDKFIKEYKQSSIDEDELRARDTSLKDMMTTDAYNKAGIANKTNELISLSNDYKKNHVLNTNTSQALNTYSDVESNIQYDKDHFTVDVTSKATDPSGLFGNYNEKQNFTFNVKDGKISNITIGQIIQN